MNTVLLTLGVLALASSIVSSLEGHGLVVYFSFGVGVACIWAGIRMGEGE